MSSTSSIQNEAVRSIVQQWSGGEHRLAGARASELVYGKSDKPNDKLMQQLMEDAPGIERYITAPAVARPIEHVPDQGGNSTVRQPENRGEDIGASNLSSEKAKDEQNRIDDVLADGREARAKAGNADVLGSTELNPAGSDQAPTGKGADTKAADANPVATSAARAPAKVSNNKGNKPANKKT